MSQRLGRAADAARIYCVALALASTGPEQRYLERRIELDAVDPST